MRDPPRGQADVYETLKSPARMRDYFHPGPDPLVCTGHIGNDRMTFALGGLAFWLPHYIVKDKKAANLGEVDVVFGIIVVVSGLVATLLGGIVGDKLRERLSRFYFMVSGFAMLLGFPMVLLVLVTGYPWYWLFYFLGCFCLFFNTGPRILSSPTSRTCNALEAHSPLTILVIHALGDARHQPLSA